MPSRVPARPLAPVRSVSVAERRARLGVRHQLAAPTPTRSVESVAARPRRRARDGPGERVPGPRGPGSWPEARRRRRGPVRAAESAPHARHAPDDVRGAGRDGADRAALVERTRSRRGSAGSSCSTLGRSCPRPAMAGCDRRLGARPTSASTATPPPSTSPPPNPDSGRRSPTRRARRTAGRRHHDSAGAEPAGRRGPRRSRPALGRWTSSRYAWSPGRALAPGRPAADPGRRPRGPRCCGRGCSASARPPSTTQCGGRAGTAGTCGGALAEIDIVDVDLDGRPGLLLADDVDVVEPPDRGSPFCRRSTRRRWDGSSAGGISRTTTAHGSSTPPATSARRSGATVGWSAAGRRGGRRGRVAAPARHRRARAPMRWPPRPRGSRRGSRSGGGAKVSHPLERELAES